MTSQIQIPNPIEQQPQPATPSETARRPHRGWQIGVAVLLIFGSIFAYGIVTRLKNAAVVRADTAQMAMPTVAVVTPQHTPPAQEVVLPGNVQPFISAPIFSRTNGYLRKW